MLEETTSNKTKIIKRNFSTNNIYTFFTFLNNETWLDVYQAPVDKKFQVFHDNFMYNFNVCFPAKLVVENELNNNMWITEEIKCIKNKIKELETNLRISKNNNLKPLIKEFKVKLKFYIKKEKKNFFDKKINSSANKSKMTWKLIKTEVNNKKVEKCNLNIVYKDEMIADPLKISNVFNDFFVSVVDDTVLPKIPHGSKNSYTQLHNKTSMKNFKFQQISELDLQKLILSFENKQSAGYDGTVFQ